MESEWLTLIGTLGGVIVGALGTLMVTWIREYYEEKRKYRELIINTSIKYWERGIEVLQKSGRRGYSWPLESYIISLAHLIDKVLDRKFKVDNLSGYLKETGKIMDELDKFYRKQSKKKR